MSNKTPASRQLLNITKALLDDANADNERIRDETIEECAHCRVIEEGKYGLSSAYGDIVAYGRCLINPIARQHYR